MQNRMLRAAVAIAAIGFVAACQAVMPTALNGVAPDGAAPSPDIPTQAPVAKRAARKIVVRAGQSLSRIAVEYHMPQRTIIAANDLTPPYKIKIGQQLLIPSADEPPPAPAVVGSPPPEIIPLDRPALPGSTAAAPTTTSAVSSGTAELPAPATTAAAPSPTPASAAAPPGVTCPSGTMGMWSEDIIKKPVYICRKVGSPS
jgi:LysM repeat protein